jgi:hypothetical protein
MEIIEPKEWFRMKHKKASIYLGSFVLMCILFSACYYMSICDALHDFNQRAIERKDKLLTLTQTVSPTPIMNRMSGGHWGNRDDGAADNRIHSWKYIKKTDIRRRRRS